MINNEMFIEDGVAFIPWLCEDEWKKLKELNVNLCLDTLNCLAFI